MLKSIDLFTGIGGMTRGLHGIATPLLYCDIAPAAQAVIKARIDDGSLPPAPIARDVRDVDGARYDTESDVMVVAGFPCVGFSVLGNQQAFDNDQSGLFMEVLRICDTFRKPPPLLFLENVTNVLRIGMQKIITELSVKRGYELRWCQVPAEIMGAPHVRSRWFCLAVRPGYTFSWLGKGKECKDYKEYPWTNDFAMTVARTTRETGPACKARCELLGNSVVPDAVRYAFMLLATRQQHTPSLSLPPGMTLAPTAEDGTKERGRRGQHARKASTKMPASGLVLAGSSNVEKQPDPVPFRRSTVGGPTIDPGAFVPRKPPSPLMKTPLIRKTVSMERWSTPRHALTGACNYLTERSIRDLPTQIRFAVDTQNREDAMAPEFLEFLMGFPIGWTRTTKIE